MVSSYSSMVVAELVNGMTLLFGKRSVYPNYYYILPVNSSLLSLLLKFELSFGIYAVDHGVSTA